MMQRKKQDGKRISFKAKISAKVIYGLCYDPAAVSAYHCDPQDAGTAPVEYPCSYTSDTRYLFEI